MFPSSLPPAGDQSQLFTQLPLEVLHQILSYIPNSHLLTTRLVSTCVNTLATSNTHWRSYVLDTLIPRHATLREILSIPPQLWSFSQHYCGWFRAYLCISNIVKRPWLLSDSDLIDSDWLVYFKSHIRGEGIGVEEYHSIVRFTEEHIAQAVGGLPLVSRQWRIEDGVMKGTFLTISFPFRTPLTGGEVVSAYPPNVPGRELRTLCRKFEHVTVAMISDCPEFLDGLVELNCEILDELIAAGVLSEEEKQVRQKELKEARGKLDMSTKGRRDRLRRALGFDCSDDERDGDEDDEDEEYDDEDEEDEEEEEEEEVEEVEEVGGYERSCSSKK